MNDREKHLLRSTYSKQHEDSLLGNAQNLHFNSDKRHDIEKKEKRVLIHMQIDQKEIKENNNKGKFNKVGFIKFIS